MPHDPADVNAAEPVSQAQFTILHSDEMDWSPTPSDTVWRKRFERDGPPEAGRVTSLVRYDANADFHSHPHPQGEEILVLDGVFSDERGDFPTGTFMLNPEGFEHAPGSDPGCILFVKLRQYGGERENVLIRTDEADWSKAGEERQLPLYHSKEHGETLLMVELEPGGKHLEEVTERGCEVFVLNGKVNANGEPLRKWSWLKVEPGQGRVHPLELRAETEATFYVRRGIAPLPPADS